ncbi:MAG: hypothetical protein AB7S38_06790 [Vulcanimicrobiota bacterium]
MLSISNQTAAPQRRVDPRISALEAREREFTSVFYDDAGRYRDQKCFESMVGELESFEPHSEEVPMRAGQVLVDFYRKIDDQRFSKELVDETRQALRQTAQHWIEAGDLKLGQVSLEEGLDKGVFRGHAGALLLEMPDATSDRLRSDLAYYDDRADRLVADWTQDGHMAEHVTQMLDWCQDGLIYAHDLRAVRRLFEEAKDSEPLREGLQPHLERLLGMADRAEVEGVIGKQSSDRVAIYGAMGQAFPELLAQDKFWQGVERLVTETISSRGDLVDSVLPLLRMAPERTEEVLQAIASAPEENLGPAHAYLFEGIAHDVDYKPSIPVMTHVLKRVIRPRIEAIWERYEDSTVEEMGAYLRGLNKFKESNADLLKDFKFTRNGVRQSPEDHLLSQFLRFDHGDFEDYNFARVSRAEGQYFPALFELVGLEERGSELLDKVRAQLSESINLDEAGAETLLSLALLANNDQPAVEEELTNLLALSRTEKFPSIRSFKEQLYRRREVARRLPSIEQSDSQHLAANTSLLLQASAPSRTEVPLSDQRQQVLDSWARRVAREPGLAELPGSFPALGVAFDEYRFLEKKRGPLAPGPAFERLKLQLGNAGGDLPKAHQLFSLEVELRQKLGEKSFDQHYAKMADYLAAHDWDPAAGREFLDLYLQQAGGVRPDVNIDIQDEGIQIGDVFLEIENE